MPAPSPESAFIAALAGLATHPAARGLADDCAVLDVGGEALVFTHDMMVEGVHWLPQQDPADVAWKLVATNLSDLAAKGAEPLGVLLGYTLTGAQDRFLDGLRAVLAEYDVPLLGGDTVGRGSGAPTHGLTAIGRATHRPVPARSGARPGDSIWTTGALGGAMMGFEALLAGDNSADTTAFRRPRARLAQGRALAPHVTAMMDLSDGLLLDAARMAAASKVTLALDSKAVPLAASVPEARRRDALGWGDDYELLFTLPEGVSPPCPAHRIGQARAAGPEALLLDDARHQGRLGFEHGTPAA